MNIPKRRNRQPTDKQRKFIDAYLKHGNSVTAYREAGYCTTSTADEPKYMQSRAWQILNSQCVQAAIVPVEQAKHENRLRADAITVDTLRDKILSVYQHCWDRGEGEEATRDVRGALSALEMLCKTVGGFSENLNITSEQRKEYTELERAEMKRLSTLLLASRQLPAPEPAEEDVIDAEVVEEGS